MRKMLNTLYITTPEAYLALEDRNVVVHKEEEVLGRFPLHTLESILYFGYKGASPALMGACGEMDIGLCFFTPGGRFQARVCGETRGNVLLRKQQYRLSDDEAQSCLIARNMIVGKVYNARWLLQRATRDHPQRVDVDALQKTCEGLKAALPAIAACKALDSLRGWRGRLRPNTLGRWGSWCCRTRTFSPLAAETAARPWTLSTPCFPLPIRCCPMTANPPWRRWGSILTWAFCIGTAPAGPPWPWI